MKHLGKALAIASICGCVALITIKVLDVLGETETRIDWGIFCTMMVIIGIGMMLIIGWIASEWGD